MNRETSSIEKPPSTLRIALGQFNFIVGNLIANQEKILKGIELAKNAQTDIILFPEMSLTGYPIQDLIFDNDFYESEQKTLQEIANICTDIIAVIGGFDIENDPHHHPKYQNVAYILSNGTIQTKIQKRLLPTYDVFDEKRYFWSGENYDPIEVAGVKVGIAICEDMWDQEYTINPAENLVQNGAQIILSINASPYIVEKQNIRESLIAEKAEKYHIPIAYLNLIGGQDELVFDGRSFVCDYNGNVVRRAPFCKEVFFYIDISLETFDILDSDPSLDEHIPSEWQIPNKLDILYNVHQEIIEALSMNLRDYFTKTGIFQRIVLGLSGGIDSAFTAYIASLAVGPERVTALLMPSRYSSSGSIDDSIQLCNTLGIQYIIVPIKDPHECLETEFENIFTDSASELDTDLADQNMQARLRGVLLMYYSNKYRALLVSTGNKSELATGYCTLYGDTNGGKNVPGDLYKTQLYEVVDWINREEQIIPQVIREKAPTAELKPNQKDEDNLPPYPVLDEILKMRIDDGLSPREIIDQGKDPTLVYHVESLYANNEYKRAQIAQTIKINKKTFGMGRKIPVLKKSKY